MGNENGLYECRLHKIWAENERNAHKALDRVEEMHGAMTEILENVKYLNKLEKLDNLDLLVENIGNNKTTILVL